MRANLSFPTTTDQAGWRATLLSLVPFILAGPVRIVVSYQPGWGPREGSLLYLVFLSLCSVMFAGGLALGAAKKFPRWSYPYPLALAFSLYLLVGYAARLVGLNPGMRNSAWLYMVVILIGLGLPGLRGFYGRARADGTLVSYGLYALVLYLLASVDFDMKLTSLILLPSLIGLGGALVHLRIRAALWRTVALLAATFGGLVFLLLPIFTGMISIWAGAVIGMLMLFVYATLLESLLLIPLLAPLAIRAWHARRI